MLDLEKMFKLIRFIYEEYNYIPAIILNPGQEFLQTDIINKYLDKNNIKYIKLKYLNIHEIISLMKKSKFIIVPDTGLYHIAVCLNLPIFSIFTYTNPKLVEPENGIYEICNKEIDEYGLFDLRICTNKMEIAFIITSFKKFVKKLIEF